MQLVRFQQDGQESWGIREKDEVRDIGSLLKTCGSMWHAIQQWESLENRIEGLLSDAAIVPAPQLLSPLPERGKTICIGLNYRDHAIETGAEIPSEPVVFNKLQGTICGPDSPIVLPKVSHEVDFEAELVLVIGKQAWQVAEAEADQHIFGYMCGHDVSARDWQKGRPGGQWLLGKSFPNFAPTGPVLVPRKYVADSGNLRVQMRINGETLQDSSTSQLIYSPAQLIAHLSQCTVLQPGDLIFTGTPPGVGAARKPPRFLRPGDICEVEIDGLGILRNPVVAAE